MASSTHRPRIYIFDASAFIELGQLDEKVWELPAAAWKRLERLMDEGTIISSKYVYDEVVINPQKPNKPVDKISRWLATKKSYFLSENNTQVGYMIEVIRKFPKLINPEYEKSQADPWLVAMAIELSEQNMDNEYVLVTQENPASSAKLPAACREYRIECINLRQFFKEIDLTLGIE